MSGVARVGRGEPRLVQREIELATPVVAVREAVRPAAASECRCLRRVGKRCVERACTLDVAGLIHRVRDLADVTRSQTGAIVSGDLIEEGGKIRQLAGADDD